MKILLPPALDALGIPTPTGVLEAMDLHKTAEEMVDRLRSQAAPTLDDVTAANADEALDKIVELELRAPVKMRHAVHLIDVAETRIKQAWEDAAQELRPKLAAGFNTAAAKLTAEVDKRPELDPETIGYQRANPMYRDIFAAADKLDKLAAVRDGFAGRAYERSAGLHSDGFETATRCLRFSHMQDAQWAQRVTDVRGVGYWVKMAQRPRITIHWNERAEQVAMLSEIKY